MSATLKYEKRDLTLPRDYDKLKEGYQKIPLNKPAPVDEEIILHPKKYLLSKTDAHGIIEYCNPYFTEVSGYRENELIGKPHSIVRHPDMPGAIFELLWEHLHRRKNIYIVVKNLAKDGRYYWAAGEYHVKVNKAIDEVQGYFVYHNAAPKHALPRIEQLYNRLSLIEKESGLEASYKYLLGLLEERGESWHDYIDGMVNTSFLNRFKQLRRKLFTDEEREISLAS